MKDRKIKKLIMEKPSQSVCVRTCPADSPLLGKHKEFRTIDATRRVPFQDRHNSRLEDLRQCTYYAKYCPDKHGLRRLFHYSFLSFAFHPFFKPYFTLFLSHLYYSFTLIMCKKCCYIIMY